LKVHLEGHVTPRFTCIVGPKGATVHLSIESFVLGHFHSFDLFLGWANQICSLWKKKGGLVKHPQLINMKQKNNYTKKDLKTKQLLTFRYGIWTTKIESN
jgi:hypothetical protein